MSNPDNVLIDDEDLCEIDPEAEEYESGLEATETPVNDGRLEFAVQMSGYQMHQLEGVIIEAAAERIIRKLTTRKIDEMIQDRCIELVTAKIDERMKSLTKEIIDRPMMVPLYGAKKEPVTIAEYIGMAGREYLSKLVDSKGKPSEGGWASNAVSRAEFLISQVIDRDFKKEMEDAKNSLASDVRRSLKDAAQKFLSEQKTKIREAIKPQAES